MKELQNTTNLVHEILIKDERARNSDNYLCAKVYQELGARNGIDISKMSVLSFFLKLSQMNLPSIETIGRCRRKLQASYPELASCDKVERDRMTNELKFREYARKVEV